MRSLADTIARLGRLADVAVPGMPVPDRLRDLTEFGSNPGHLGARYHVPEGLAVGAPLVVVLHGCTQTAAAYDHGAGWSALADRHGFALLFPEQRRANNANLCFNWFEPADTRRDQGEAFSIAQMVRRLCKTHHLNRSRVYINGLSAGGAMTAVLLAAYPELFAGGSIIAGLPYGCAASIPQAFDRMRGQGFPDAAALPALVRRASPYSGVRPSLSVWHGTADTTVAPSNVEQLVRQWGPLLDVPEAPDAVEETSGFRRSAWRRRDGTVALETWLVRGMGHGTPICPESAGGYGTAGPFMIDVGLSSTAWMAFAWGLAPHPGLGASRGPQHRPTVGGVIEQALRAAGLMR